MLWQIVPQEYIDPDALLPFDRRQIFGLGHRHALGATHLVAGIPAAIASAMPQVPPPAL